MRKWTGVRRESPLPPGYEQFLATGDHLETITRVCIHCGCVVATNYTDVHRTGCPKDVTGAQP